MTDNVKVKRSFTVPILFLIMMVLLTLIVIFYSKYLLTQQGRTTEQGQKISESYNYAILFAQNLQEGADGLLNAKSDAQRIRSAILLGEAKIASNESINLFTEAASRTSGQNLEEAGKPFLLAMNKLIGANSPLSTIGKHEGSFTSEEIEALTRARDIAAKMQEALSVYRPLPGEANFRLMVTEDDWVPSATKAGQVLVQAGS